MILADENIHFDIIAALRKIHIDVLSIKESYRGIQDEKIIHLAQINRKIIHSEDKDFGEWVFSHNIKGISVIFLRYHFSERAQVIFIFSKILKNNPEKFLNKFTTITTRKIRSREI